jgi:hypothetical protein
MPPVLHPRLSVVVALVSDTTSPRLDTAYLVGCLEALSTQIDPPSMEVIVPYHQKIEGVGELRVAWPAVRFVAVDDPDAAKSAGASREHHDRLRACGLAAARGDLVALLEDHGRPDRRWSRQLDAAHRGPYVAVGGAIENGIDRPLNWAVYFCDFLRYQNPVPTGDSFHMSDANASYRRTALEAIRPIWQAGFHEPHVNAAMLARGGRIALSAEMIVYQHRSGLRISSALRERFVWGRSYAAAQVKNARVMTRLVRIALSPLLPAVLLARMTRLAVAKGRCIGAFCKALPLTILLTVWWSIGELAGYLTARSGSKKNATRRNDAVTPHRPVPSGSK